MTGFIHCPTTCVILHHMLYLSKPKTEKVVILMVNLEMMRRNDEVLVRKITFILKAHRRKLRL